MTLLTKAAPAYPLEGDLMYSPAGRRYAYVVDRILARKSLSGQLLITSAVQDEGKTVTAANLALALHARRIPVLLVELSLMRPKFAEIFGDSPVRKGVEDVLGGRSDLHSVVCVRGDNNLHLAMVGRAQDSEERLAPSLHLDRLIEDARRDYQWTIFDGPAIESSPYICTLIGSIGLSLMVARARQTDRNSFYDAFSRISNHRPMVLLNDEHPRSSRSPAIPKL